MVKNSDYVGVVSRLGSNGEGIVREKDCTVFVPYALPKEKIRYKILKVKKNVAFGKVIEVCTPAEARIRPKCPVYEKCGGCQLQHLKYKLQLKLKSQIVKDCFSKIAFLDADIPPLAVRSELEYGYRNKLQLPVRTDSFGCVIGFFAQNSHRVVPINGCPIQPEWCNRIISVVKEFIETYSVPVYSDETCQGLVKHVVVRDVDGRLLITIVINGNSLPHSDDLINLLKKYFNKFSLFININKLNNNVVLTDEYVCLYGKKNVVSSDLGVKFEIGPGSFMQVNDGVKRKIYRDALKEAEVDEETTVIDAFSGTGMLTAIFAQKCKKAIGVEIVREAVDCADDLRIRNGLQDKMQNVCAACEDVLPDILARERASAKKCVLVLDPPRQGVEESLIESINKSLPDRIIYISCSPQTLARDVGLLVGSLKRNGDKLEKSDCDGAYEIDVIRPYDMFPQTKHVETLVCLSKKSEKHISIDVEFGESDGQISLKKLQEELSERKQKKKTTYKDIQKWVEENYGFKVHTAYIAEVKRDLGLPMYDAPNAVEELKRPRSHPTAEMSDAIKAALKHFEII